MNECVDLLAVKLCASPTSPGWLGLLLLIYNTYLTWLNGGRGK